MKQESKEYYGDLAGFYDWRLQGDVEDITFYVELQGNPAVRCLN